MSEHEDERRARGLRNKRNVTGRLTPDERTFLEEFEATPDNQRGPLVRTEQGLTRIAPGAPVPEGGRVVEPTKATPVPRTRRGTPLSIMEPSPLQLETRERDLAAIAEREAPPEPPIQRTIEEAAEIISGLFPDLTDGILVADESLTALQQHVEADPDAFAEELFGKGRTDDTVFILELFGLGEVEIDDFFVGAPSGQDAALVSTLTRIFPDRDIDATLEFAKRDQEAFLEEIREVGITTDTWELMRTAFPDLSREDLVSFFGALPQQPSNAFLEAIQTGFQFAEGWWKIGLMETGFEFYRGMEWVRGDTSRWTSDAEAIMDSAYQKYGWKAIFSGEVNHAWDTYFAERDVRGPAKVVAEFANPLWLIPLGGALSRLSLPLLKVPVLGATMQKLATSVTFLETAPIRLPLLGTRTVAGAGKDLLARRAFGKEAIPHGERALEKFLLKELPSPELMMSWMFKNDAFQKIASHIPGMKFVAPATVIGEVPWTLATNQEITGAVTQQLLMRTKMLELGQAYKGQALAFIREVDTTRAIFNVNKEGFASSRFVKAINEGDSLALGDILQAPEQYVFTHPRGLEYAKRVQQMFEEPFQLAKAEGIDINRVGLEPWQEFVHWVVTGKLDKNGVLEATRRGSRAVGGITASQKARRFQTQQGGIEAGYQYADDAEIYVGSYIDDIFKAIADKRLGDGLAQVIDRVEDILPTGPLDRLQALYPGAELAWTGIRKEMADLGFAFGAVKRASRGEVIPSATMRSIRQRGGDVGLVGEPLTIVEGRSVGETRVLIVTNQGGDEWRVLISRQGDEPLGVAQIDVARVETKGVQEGLPFQKRPGKELSQAQMRQVLARLRELDPEIKTLQGFRFVGPDVPMRKLSIDVDKFLAGGAPTTQRGKPVLAGVAERLDTAMSISGAAFDREVVRFSNVIWDAAKTTPAGLKQRIADLRGQAIDAAHPVRAGEIDAALKSLNADATATVRIIQQFYRNTHTTRRGVLVTLQKELKGQIDSLKPDWWKARSVRSEKLGIVSRPMLGAGEGQIRTASGSLHPMFQNQVYPEAIATQVTKLLNDDANVLLRATAVAAGTARLPVAALDISPAAIQGITTLFDPLTAPRAIVALIRSIDTFIRPNSLQRYLARNAESMNERIFHLGSQRPFEFFESMGWISKIAGVVPGGKWVVGQTYGRGQAAFSMWSTVYKDMMWKSSSKNWVRKGQGAEFARILDRSTGSLSFNALGVPANLQKLATGWVSFAPQYALAVASFFAEMFKGGMTGAFARNHIARAMAGAFVMYYAWTEALGKERFLNPIEDGKRFLSIEIDGRWIGPGSRVISMMRAWSDIAASAASIGENEPMDFLTLDRWQNPVLRAWYTQSSVLTSLVTEVAQQRDFLGYPIETVGDWADWALEKVTPIFAQDALFDKSGVPPTLLATGADFFGWRTSPESRWERLNDRILSLQGIDSVSDLTDEQRAAIKGGDTVLSTLDRVQKIELFEAYPELEPLYEAAAADALVRASQTFKNYTTATLSIRETAMNGLQAAIDVGIQDNEQDTKWLRDRYNAIMSTYGDQNSIIRDVEEYQPLFEEWDDNKEKRREDAEVIDLAYWDYIEQVVAPDYLLASGDFDFGAYKNSLQLFRDEWGEDVYQNILKILEANKADFPEWAVRLWKDRAALSDADFWALPYQPLRLMSQADLDDDRVPEQFRPAVEALLAADEEQREALIAASPDLDKDWRNDLRQQNPEMDARLALWGYGGKLQSEAAYDLVVQWGGELDIPLSAMGLGIPPRQHLEAFFGLNEVVSRTSGSSAEARLFKKENPEYLTWGIDQGIWKDDLSGESIDALRLQVEWQETQDQFDLLETRELQERFRTNNPDWVDSLRRREAFGWNPNQSEAVVEAHVIYGGLVDQHGANSAEVMLWRLNDRTGYEKARQNVSPLDPVDKARAPIWRLDVKLREDDLRYDIGIPESFASTARAEQPEAIREARARFLEDNPEYRMDRRRREAYELGIAAKQVEAHVALYELPERGFRRERWLEAHAGYYEDVWLGILGNSAVDFSRTPNVKVDEIWEQWEPQMRAYYSEIPEEVRLLTGRAKAVRQESLREALFAASPAFFEARIRYEGHRALVPDTAIDGYVRYYTTLTRGKPEGWDQWWQDDRALRDSPEFYAWALETLGWQTRDFDRIPSEEFERAYNETYINLTKVEGGVEVANRVQREEYRARNPDFDAEGVKAGLWKSVQPRLAIARVFRRATQRSTDRFSGLRPTR